MFRLLAALFILTGLALTGCAGWQLACAYALTHAPGVQALEGEITGYHRILSRYRDSAGRERTGTWFPQPVFRYTDPQGREHKAVDPGFHLFERYRPGDRVALAWLPADAPIGRDTLTALLTRPGIVIDDFFTRYLFWGAVLAVGLPFIILPLWVGVPSATARAALLDRPLPPNLPFTARHLLWVLFGLFAFAALMASKEHLLQLLPAGQGEALVEAARRGDLPAVRQLLEAGADVNHHDRTTGETPIMSAYYHAHPEVARLLLEGGFDPRVEDKVGRNLVYYAARAGDLPALERLLAAGAPVTSSFDDVLSAAIARRMPEIALLLVAHGHPLDHLTEGDGGRRFYPGDLAILAGLPTVVADIARRGGPFTAPRGFVDAALGREVTAGGEAAGFGRMTLARWLTLCAGAGTAPGRE